MDIRYNMINWVHRSTRGWSSGGTVADPRTGEIIKATVTLGSLRDRQDYLIFEGLLSPYTTGDEKPDVLYQTRAGAHPAARRARSRPYARPGPQLLRQHPGMDLGDGLPASHGEAAADGTIDLSEAYAARIGDWDKGRHRLRLPPVLARRGPRGAGQDSRRGLGADLRYMTNQDTDIHPRVDQWSNGVDQAAELNRIMKIRRAALNRLGEHTIRNGAPNGHHRGAAGAHLHVSPLRGGIRRFDGGRAGLHLWHARRWARAAEMESAASQRQALDALAATLKPSELAVPRQVLDAIPPRPPGFGLHRELFPRTTGEGFDPLSPATVAADVTIGFVLQLDRAARMVAQHAVDASLPGLEEVIDRLTKAVFDAPAASPYEAEIRRATERVLVDRMMGLATHAPNGQVRATGVVQAGEAGGPAEGRGGRPGRSRTGATRAAGRRHQAVPGASADPMRMMPAPGAPPGAPIGGDSGMDWLAPAPPM